MISPFLILVLLLLTGTSMFTDIRWRKIPNWLTFGGILSGFFYHAITGGITGLQYAGLGFAVGLAILIIPFFKGGIGAGDVKLLAAIGAWAGVDFLLPACLWMGVTGCAQSVYAIWKQRIWKLAFIGITFKEYKTGSKVPYGIAIGLGVWIEIARLLWFSSGGGI